MNKEEIYDIKVELETIEKYFKSSIIDLKELRKRIKCVRRRLK